MAGNSVNDRLLPRVAGLTLVNSTGTATNTLTTGVRLMKVVVNNGTLVGSVTVWNATATSGTAGFALTCVANGTTVLDLEPDGFVVLGGAVTVVGSAHLFTVAG